MGQEPLSKALPLAFAFSDILYPLSSSVFLTVDLLGLFIPKSQWGLPCFMCVTCGGFGFHLCSGRDFTPSSLTSALQRLTCLPFGMACHLVSPFSLHGAYDDSLALTLALLSLAKYIKRAVRIFRFCALQSLGFIAYFLDRRGTRPFYMGIWGRSPIEKTASQSLVPMHLHTTFTSHADKASSTNGFIYCGKQI